MANKYLSLVVAMLSLIPNHPLRYTLLGLVAAIYFAFSIHFDRPSTLLLRLEVAIQQAEDNIDKDKVHRHRLSFLQEELRLVEVRRSASAIHLRVLETRRWAWLKSLRLSRDIAGSMKDVEKIQTAVEVNACIISPLDLASNNILQLNVEVERQRRYTKATNETLSFSASYCTGNGKVNALGFVEMVAETPYEDCAACVDQRASYNCSEAVCSLA
ncbi:hypothetical protein C8R47DRAFT_1245789 [Mycena vitilis]|nr:hypothetical protein C8R47DRAFT_1245789 [Mycena vitilis]